MKEWKMKKDEVREEEMDGRLGKEKMVKEMEDDLKDLMKGWIEVVIEEWISKSKENMVIVVLSEVDVVDRSEKEDGVKMRDEGEKGCLGIGEMVGVGDG